MTYVLAPSSDGRTLFGMTPQSASCAVSDLVGDPAAPSGRRIVTPPGGKYRLDGRRTVPMTSTRDGQQVSFLRWLSAPLDSPVEVVEITGDPAVPGNVTRGVSGTKARTWPEWCELVPVP